VSTLSTTTQLGRDLRAICGAEHVVEDPAELSANAIHGVVPAASVAPASADEVAAVIRLANQRGLTVVPAGGFTQQTSGSRPEHIDVLLNTTRLTEVEHYDPGDLTIGIGAGCTVAQLSSKVGADGLLFAGDAASPERSTLGGLLATGMSGPLRQGYGGLRDYCIGIRFVTGDGRKAKGGGRVVKNVAGYDLMKLLIGSQGTLAIITSASFKLFPAPRKTRTFIADFASSDTALEFRDSVLHSPLSPICLELISPQTWNLAQPDTSSPVHWSVCLRAAGSEAVLSRYRKELGAAVTREAEGEPETSLWRLASDFMTIAPKAHPNASLLALSLALKDVREVLGRTLPAVLSGLEFAAVGRIGVGHLLVAFWPRASSHSTEATVALSVAIDDLRRHLPAHASMAVLLSPDAGGKFWGPLPTDAASMRALKQALDPKDILNRGRFSF
jgi:glycolate oxidase FAD binding subunit